MIGPILRAVAALAEADAAREVCGFVLGAGRTSGPELVAARNVAPEPERSFRVDPRDVLAVLRRADREGREVLALYHSHPTGGSQLSGTDLQELAVDGTPLLPGVELWVVALVNCVVADARGYRWRAGGFAEAWHQFPPFG